MRTAVMAVVVSAVAWAVWPGMAAGQDRPSIPVQAEEVRVETVERSVQAVGTLRADESVVIRPEIAGRLKEIFFDEGQPVAAGQLLLRLEDEVYRAQVEQAEANLALSRANAERAQQLHGEGVGTQRALDEANARLRSDEASLALARAMLAKTVVRAPFDGIAGLRQVSVGAYVTPGEDVANLAAIDPMKVDFRVAETLLAAVKVGQPLQIQVDAYADRSFSGQVYAIDPVVDEAGRSVLIRARVANADRVLRPGLFARVQLVVQSIPEAVTVPEEALMPDGEAMVVYTVVDGAVQAVPVTTGLRRGGRVQVTDGLAPGDVVVTAGHLKLRPGAAVAVLDQPDA